MLRAPWRCVVRVRCSSSTVERGLYGYRPLFLRVAIEIVVLSEQHDRGHCEYGVSGVNESLQSEKIKRIVEVLLHSDSAVEHTTQHSRLDMHRTRQIDRTDGDAHAMLHSDFSSETLYLR